MDIERPDKSFPKELRSIQLVDAIVGKTIQTMASGTYHKVSDLLMSIDPEYPFQRGNCNFSVMQARSRETGIPLEVYLLGYSTKGIEIDPLRVLRSIPENYYQFFTFVFVQPSEEAFAILARMPNLKKVTIEKTQEPAFSGPTMISSDAEKERIITIDANSEDGFVLNMVRLRGNDDDLKHLPLLKHLAQLQELKIQFAVSKAGILCISKLPHIESLTLKELTPEGAQALPQMPCLRSLTIVDLKNDGVIEYFPQIRVLQSLRIYHGQLPSQEIKKISKCTSLRKLVLPWGMDEEITDEDIEKIANLADLEELDCSYKGQGQSFSYFAKLTKLKILTLRCVDHLTPGAFQCLAAVKRLQKLSFNYHAGSFLNDEALHHLSQLPDLEELDLSGSDITDNGLDDLKNVSKLRKIFLYNTRVTAKKIGELKKYFWDHHNHEVVIII